MGFKINNRGSGFVPDGEPTTSELADFIEIKAILSDDGNYSITDVKTPLGIACDESRNTEDSLVDADEVKIEEAFSEIEERRTSATENYPFLSSQFSVTLDNQCDAVIKDVYTFLLFVTRVNMNTMKTQNGIDATKTFEQLCSAIMENYWGNSAKAFVIGTGSETSDFETKINNAINAIGEPRVQFRWPDGSLKKEKDAKVDVIAYIPFADDRRGRFIAIGQCKTGTSWQSSISQLVPQSFNTKYFSPPFTFTPVVLFLVSEAFYENWETYQRDSHGLLLDRCRLMQYLPESLSDGLLNNIREWNRGIIELLSS